MFCLTKAIDAFGYAVYRFPIALILTLTWSCSSEKQGSNPQENFPVARPVLKDTTFAREYVAEIQSIQNVELRARVTGFIDRIYVDEGQPVKAGQLLFTIGNQSFKEDLQKAHAVLRSAMAEYKIAAVELKNTRTLVERDVVAATELEMAEAKYEAIEARIDEARSAVSLAELDLSFTAIKAPFSGVINRIPNKVGSLVEEGTLLTSISNNSEVFAYFNMSEKEYLEFIKRDDDGANKSISLVTADNQPYDFKGVIETVESEINKSTGTIAFRARFPNPSHLLKHGSSGKVLLQTPIKDALLIPQKSTFAIQENLYVYAVDNDNTVQLRRVVPLLRLPHVYVIKSGISPEDSILYEGIQLVKEGDKIVPSPISLDQDFLEFAKW